MGDLGSIPGLGRSPGEGKGYPLQYFGLENPMDYIVHSVTKSQTLLSDFHFTSLQLMRVLPLVSRKEQAADAAEHPTKHRTAPHLSSAKVEKP